MDVPVSTSLHNPLLMERTTTPETERSTDSALFFQMGLTQKWLAMKAASVKGVSNQDSDVVTPDLSSREGGSEKYNENALSYSVPFAGAETSDNNNKNNKDDVEMRSTSSVVGSVTFAESLWDDFFAVQGFPSSHQPPFRRPTNTVWGLSR